MRRLVGRRLFCVRGERSVFGGLDFELASGGALVLTGPNGSGKSSLLRLIAGLLPPAAGELAWEGGDDEPGLHYVGHQDAIKPVLTVAENLAFAAAAAGFGAERVGPALAAFGIAQLADLPGRFLSAGQRRRLALARVLAAPAALWLLDEPATALDRSAVARLEAIVAGHRAEGGMVALSTHAALAVPGSTTLDLADYAVPPEAAA